MTPDRFDAALEAARRNEPLGFDALWHDYAPGIGAYFRTHGERDAEDLTNETFFRAFRDLDRFVGGEPEFRAWLYAIARGRWLDELRRRSRRPRWADCEPPEVPVAADTETVAHARSVERAVEAAIAALEPAQRDVLVLRIVADLGVREVAALLGKSETAVKALQRRGVAALGRAGVREILAGPVSEPVPTAVEGAP